MLVGEASQTPLFCIFQCRLRVPAGRFLSDDTFRVIEDLHKVRCSFCQRSMLHLFRDRRIQKRNVVQPGESAGFVQQGDALGTPAHIAVHPVVPNIIVGAGGGIGALGVDHELVRKRVLVQPGCGGQVVRSAFPGPGQTIRHVLGKGEIFFGFAWHFGLLLQILGIKKGPSTFRIVRPVNGLIFSIRFLCSVQQTGNFIPMLFLNPKQIAFAVSSNRILQKAS